MLATKLRHLSQRGDTIVEVMVVLAVLGLSIGIAYATANRSTRANQRAQDNSQAVALLKGQVELLRSMANQDSVYTNQPFCIPPTTETVTPATSSSCTFDTSNYKIKILYSDTDPNNPDLFTLTITWDDVDGGTASSTIVYRVHKSP